MRKGFLLLLILISILGSACTSISEINGSMPLNNDVQRLEIGKDNKMSVLKLIGEPINRETAHLNSWLYAQQRTKTFAFFKPEVIERQILNLTFDQNDFLVKIESYDINDGKAIDPSSKRVVTEGRKLSFWQQISGNIGNLSGEQFIN